MSPLELVGVATVLSVPLGVLWGAASFVIGRRYDRRLARYDAALLAVANEGRDPR